MFHCLVIKVLCLSVSQTARLLYHIHQRLSSTFFKFFSRLFRCLCIALKRLDYFITCSFLCQQLFLLFSKLFKLFIQKKQLFVTAQLEYHYKSILSTPFSHFFIFLFRCQLQSGIHFSTHSFLFFVLYLIPYYKERGH